MTVADCVRQAVVVLVQAGFTRDDAHRDVAVLARHLFEWDMASWLIRQRDVVPMAIETSLAALTARRARGEPVAYLTGHREFFGRSFVVTPAVLIPRPETELLVERAFAILASRRGQFAIDVGTGSGCIAVTIAAERPDVRITATDTSDAALSIASINAARHGASDRIRFLRGSLTSGATGADIVVSNPPYVSARDRECLMRDVRDFEPASALFGGDDGLDVIAGLVPDAFRALLPGGAMLLEIGAGQADAVVELARRTGFEAVTTHRDLAGITRVVEASRPRASV